MKKTWVQTTLEKIESGTLQEGEIRVIRQRIGHAVSRCSYAKISPNEARAIIAAIEARRPFVSDAQARKGADWLAKIAFRKNGTQRQTETAQEFSTADLAVIRSLQSAPVFCFVGFEEFANGYRSEFFPVYKALSDAGSFSYCAAAWQSGARSFIVRHA